jgi:acyl-homoserine-lactone acylase
VHRRKKFPVVILSVLSIIVSVGLPGTALADPGGPGTEVRSAGYAAVIRRTAYGVPHILAANLGSVTFGQGWAYAEDRFCDLMDMVIKVRGERAKYLGPGPDDIHVATDFGYRALGLVELAQAQNARLGAEERQLLDGYVAGFDAFLAATGPANVPGWCAGASWIQPISAVDVLAYQRNIALFASGDALLLPVALASPPGAATLSTGPAVAASTGSGLERLTDSSSEGSNAWAIGAERSSTGKGMLVGNPHFPWQGELRFWESHLRVPGQLDVYGAGLGGLPGIQIGFTDKVSWSHTVAAGSRFTFYTVDLVDGDPTSYYIDGVPEQMREKNVTIAVNTGGGATTQVSRTMYSTRYGPVLDLSSQSPALGWTSQTALTYRDANIDNDRMLRQWFNIARAADTAGIRNAINNDQGIPWVNIIAADRNGNAFYADPSQTPALSPAAQAEWVATGGFLDGSDSANAWIPIPGARSPGLIPFAQQPQLTRRDYVFNANDSHWVPHASQFLVGYSPLQGPEGTPLTPRSRQNLRLINSTAKWTVAGLGSAILSGNTFTSDESTAATVAACRARGSTPVVVDGTSVNLTPGCAALAAWDKKFDLPSKGAVLWRETVFSVIDRYPNALYEAGPLFGVPFNPADPGNTPRGAPADTQPLLEGLARAMVRMRSLGFAYDVRLDAVQYTLKKGEKIPVPGTTEELGIANVVEYTPVPGSTLEPVLDAGARLPNTGSDLTRKGYVINTGTSFLLTMGWTSTGAVEAKALLTFGESGNPASPHFSDQTRLFSQKKLRECRWTEASILTDPALRIRAVTG